ncbi:hypothetical protein LCGC14_0593650 [marine sediment metagenome]|uniref:Uncharacterized protein n=1 Tax=marine sediment metagenome TaxID=412755 RepID=A0A0F9RCR2_9ZZZZ
MILQAHWSDMTFYMKDVIWFCTLLIPLVVAYVTIYANKKRIEKLEKKTDNLKEIFSNLRVTMVELKLEILEEVRKIFNNNK